MYEELVKRLRDSADWADGNIWEVPIMLPDNLKQAADAIEELKQNIEQYKLYLQDAINDLRSAHEKEPKWISVEERLPDFMHLVLAWVKNKDPEGRFNKDGVYVARLEDKIPQHDPEGKRNFWGIPGYDSEWTVYAWSYFTELEVTHWMPLPEPPEVREND